MILIPIYFSTDWEITSDFRFSQHNIFNLEVKKQLVWLPIGCKVKVPVIVKRYVKDEVPEAPEA